MSWFARGIFVLLGVAVSMYAKPNIMILATGGTIAGEAKAGTQTTDYQAGSLGIDVIVQAIPELDDIADISGEQVVNIDSSNMTDDIWLNLARRVNDVLSSSRVDGVVITHGTDTMEETAYFLNLVVKSNKPVVITGAMRPATSMSADGPKNLYNAVALAGAKEAVKKGVLVVMNDRIFSARDVSKTHTLNTDAFGSPNSGEVGYILDGKPYFNTQTIKPHTTQTPFNVKNLKELPKVDIVYTYSQDGSKVAIDAFLNAGAKGLIVAGSGAGSIHENQKKYLINLLERRQVAIVKSSRVGAGFVPVDAKEKEQGFISGNNLNPQKARVLLMLALTKSNNPKDIAQYFEEF